jgi:hypothetical protein
MRPGMMTMTFVSLSLVAASALAQDRELPVRMLGGRCGEHVERGSQPTTYVRATASARGEVTISLRQFPYYCAPAPRFDARLRVDGTLVLTAREPDGPTARCNCHHDVRLRVSGVPPGPHAIEVTFRGEVRERAEVTVPEPRRGGARR